MNEGVQENQPHIGPPSTPADVATLMLLIHNATEAAGRGEPYEVVDTASGLAVQLVYSGTSDTPSQLRIGKQVQGTVFWIGSLLL